MTHWARYTHAGETGFGILHDGRIAEHSGDLFDDPQATGRELELAEVELLTPVQPSKMVDRKSVV